MENEVKEKLEVPKKRGDNEPVSMYLKDIPARVHKKILRYRSDLMAKHRGRTFTVAQAYLEFLKESAKSIQ